MGGRRWAGVGMVVLGAVAAGAPGSASASSVATDAVDGRVASHAVRQQAGAQPVVVVGDFYGDVRDELVIHRPGPAWDSFVEFSDGGSPQMGTVVYPMRVQGSYRPVAADIDADDHDELIWYAPGPAADYVWDVADDMTVTSRPLRVDGYYVPVVGNLTGDGNDEVFWYGPGARQDHLWVVDEEGGITTVPQTVNGPGYTPVVGSYGTDATDDIVWYDPDPAVPDTLWDFRQGTTTHDTRPLTVTRPYVALGLDVWDDNPRTGAGRDRSLEGGSDILWYGLGAAPDHLWDFRDGARLSSRPLEVAGRYGPVVTGDVFGDNEDDVLWFTGDGTGRLHVWNHEMPGAGPPQYLWRHRATIQREAWQADGPTPTVSPTVPYTSFRRTVDTRS